MKNCVNPYVNKLIEFTNYILPCYSNKIEDNELKIASDIFSSYDNIIVEICSGSGMHLLELARKNPTSLIVGFELRFKRIFMTAKKASKEELKNILLIRNDARNITTWFKNHKISSLYINFPDPWDKDRWEKHRVLSKEFFEKISKILITNGNFLYKTDHKERFLEVADMIKENNCFQIIQYSENLYDSEYIEDNIKTEFESLFISQGLKINYLKAKFSE